MLVFQAQKQCIELKHGCQEMIISVEHIAKNHQVPKLDTDVLKKMDKYYLKQVASRQ
jgi:hypothetical protein